MKKKHIKNLDSDNFNKVHNEPKENRLILDYLRGSGEERSPEDEARDAVRRTFEEIEKNRQYLYSNKKREKEIISK